MARIAESFRCVKLHSSCHHAVEEDTGPSRRRNLRAKRRAYIRAAILMSRRRLPFTRERPTAEFVAEIRIFLGKKLLRLNVFLLVATWLVGATGCSTPQVSLAPEPREYIATDYEVVLA